MHCGNGGAEITFSLISTKLLEQYP